ncbi:carotenoid oxygenase family protein [Roseomonas sp. AR75]|uniref:carotenoid oxygenase family protein n=1 Tax=Roseomonas sp. AR75 TaxID=2562311 RepID=UPI0010C07361|nr:carotenoid oxygenase family protein [Roseomonas sp. AR75]
MSTPPPWTLRRTPLDWVSDDPHLSGAFAPVGPEIDAEDLEVVAGRIPPALRGTYMRNGPNPEFKPISYTYPFDGDGMIHAVRFEDGRARYRNRFVRTRALTVERRAGRAVYGGIMHPVPVDPTLVGEDGQKGPYKIGAYINVLRHAGQILALNEASPAYAMTAELETLGEWCPGTEQPISIGAHNRRHPRTGSLFGISYAVTMPLVDVHEIGADGRRLRSFPVPLAAPSMIHDFVLTERHLVLLVGPAIFDAAAAAEGKPFLQWRPEIGTRIGVVPLDGGAVRWMQIEPFFVFHFANGFERGGEIVLDYVRHAALSLGPTSGPRVPPRLHRLVLDLAGGPVRDAALVEFGAEFPRVNDLRETQPTRFVYLPTRSASLAQRDLPTGSFNTLVKVDCETGATWRHDFGNRVIGEAVFIPDGGEAEDAGYLATYAFEGASGRSDLVLLHASDLAAEPAAVIRMPQRVPQGLHGNWIPAA